MRLGKNTRGYSGLFIHSHKVHSAIFAFYSGRLNGIRIKLYGACGSIKVIIDQIDVSLIFHICSLNLVHLSPYNTNSATGNFPEECKNEAYKNA